MFLLDESQIDSSPRDRIQKIKRSTRQRDWFLLFTEKISGRGKLFETWLEIRKPWYDLTDKVESQLRLTQDIAKSKSSVVFLFTLLRTNWFPFFSEINMDLFHITSSKFRIWKEATIYITEIKLFFDFFN